MPSAIIRERAMSSCSLVIPTSAARGLCHAASDWVGSFAITIRRQHKIARPRFNLPLSHHRCDQEIAEARATRFATPLSQLRRLVELATRRTNYKFLRQSNFLTIRGGEEFRCQPYKGNHARGKCPKILLTFFPFATRR